MAGSRVSAKRPAPPRAKATPTATATWTGPTSWRGSEGLGSRRHGVRGCGRRSRAGRSGVGSLAADRLWRSRLGSGAQRAAELQGTLDQPSVPPGGSTTQDDALNRYGNRPPGGARGWNSATKIEAWLLPNAVSPLACSSRGDVSISPGGACLTERFPLRVAAGPARPCGGCTVEPASRFRRTMRIRCRRLATTRMRA